MVTVDTPWDARSYDRSSQPQQAWAADVLARLGALAPDATVLDVGCGTGRVTEALLALVPRGRVLAIDASPDMVTLARERLGERAVVWREDVLELELDEPVDAVVSTAALHWVADRRPSVAAARAGAAPRRNARDPMRRRRKHQPRARGHRRRCARPRARARGLVALGLRWATRDRGALTRCRLHRRQVLAAAAPTCPQDVDRFVRTSILAAHFERLPAARRERFAAAVVARVRPPLDYVRLNASAVRGAG